MTSAYGPMPAKVTPPRPSEPLPLAEAIKAYLQACDHLRYCCLNELPSDTINQAVGLLSIARSRVPTLELVRIWGWEFR